MGLGSTTTASVTITHLNSGPVANDLTIPTNEDVAVSIQLTATDPDNDALTYNVVTSPTHGTLSGTTPDLIYTPQMNYNGPDYFTFQADDGSGGIDTGNVAITVNMVNDAPVAYNQTITLNEGEFKPVILAATDIDEDSLSYQIITSPTHGMLAGDVPDVTYTPDPDYNGADSFTFKANDSYEDSNTATVSMMIIAANDAPVASDDSAGTEEDTPVTTVNVLDNDTDADEDLLTVSNFNQPANGTAVYNGDGTFTYFPNPDYTGMDSFTYSVDDGKGGMATAAVTVTVNSLNDPPFAQNKEMAINEGQSTLIKLIAVDIDEDSMSFQVMDGPSHGSLTGIAPDLTYTPEHDYNGTDFFTFNANDGLADGNTATVSITINPANDPPLARDDMFNEVANPVIVIPFINILANDTDIDNDSLSIVYFTQPANGTLTAGGNDTFIYTPSGASIQEDSFAYTIDDGNSGIDNATVTINLIYPPSITITKPGGNEITNCSYTVQWTDEDTDDDASISLYYDTDSEGDDGTLIAEGLNEDLDGTDDMFVWDVTKIPEGDYYIYAVINDGVNAPVADYSDGIITIERPMPDEIKLTASDGSYYDNLGIAVAINGDYAVVGAYRDDPGDSGEYEGAGSAYIYMKECLTWSQQAKLIADDVASNDNFGTSVSINGNRIIVGAPNHDTGGYGGYGGYSGAAYVFEGDNDTWYETGKLVASDADYYDLFGTSVSISGDSAIVGAPYDDTGGYGGYGGYTDSGSAYIFQNNYFSWDEVIKLSAIDGDYNDQFGTSVSIDGDYAVVGAPYNDAGGYGGYSDSGAVYIFKRDGATWIEETKLVASDADYDDHFGYSVFISGNYVIVGAPYEDAGGYGGYGGYSDSGSVYIFERNNDIWSETAKISASDGAEYDNFGNSVSIEGDYVIVGAPFNDGGGYGGYYGAAYVYKREGSNWIELDKYTASDAAPYDMFGTSVAISQGFSMAGAPYNDVGGYGGYSDSGAAYIYPDNAYVAKPAIEISAAPEAILVGDSSTLTWAAMNADEVSIDQGIGSVNPTGSIAVSPLSTTTYTFMLSGRGGTDTETITINVVDPAVPPSALITASPDSISYGTGSILSWSATNALTASIDHGIGNVPLSGFLTVTPSETTTYTITSTNPEGDANANVTVSVTYPAPVVDIWANPQEIPVGGTTVLSWNSSKAGTVSIDQGIGDVDPAGTYTVAPADTTIYTITATGSGGTITDSVTVTLNRKPSITITKPQGSYSLADINYNIEWTDDDPDDNAEISLYYDTDAGGADGTLIKNTIMEDASNGFLWNTGSLAEGLYYVYAIINDGINEPVISYSSDPVIIQHQPQTHLTGNKIVPMDSELGDHFGFSVAIDNDYAIVGAYGEDNNGSDAGAAYIFKRENSRWIEKFKLIASDGDAYDLFGYSVSISGDYAVVGARYDEDNGTRSGSAYIFKKDGEIWTEMIKLTPGDGDLDDEFGCAVAINGDYIIVGAQNDNDSGWDSGSAYIFIRNGESWIEKQKLTAGDGTEYDLFGSAVSIDGDYTVIGAWGEDHGYYNPSYAGGLYVFKRDGETWSEQKKFTYNRPNDFFAYSVDIDGENIISGAPYDSEEGSYSGSALIYKRDMEEWGMVKKLIGHDTIPYDSFGMAVSISGNYIIAGASEDDDSGYDSGSAYLFNIQGTDWVEKAKLVASDASEKDFFGRSVAISGGYAIVGAVGDDDAGDGSGSAYIYQLLYTNIQSEQDSLLPGESTTLSWTSTLADSCVIEPGIGSTIKNGSITVYPTETTTYTITATGPLGTSTDSVTIYIIDPAVLPATTLTAASNSIIQGQSTTLSWTSSNAMSRIIDHGIGDVPSNGSISISPVDTTTYTITAAGPAGTDTATVTVTVTIPEPVVNIYANPETIVSGNTATLTWNAHFADTVSIDQGIGPVGLMGTMSVSPTETTTYTITATGPSGTITNSVKVVVNYKPTVNIYASPNYVVTPGSTTLVWNTLNAETCTIDNGIGEVATSGYVSVSPTETTTYTLRATGPGGTRTASTLVFVYHQPEVSINANPQYIIPGESTTLTWSSSNANYCSIWPEIGSVLPNGSVTITPLSTTTYYFSASNDLSSNNDSVTVNVTITPLVRGTMIDSDTSEPIAGGTVTITDNGNTHTGITDSNGKFYIDNIVPGLLTATFEKEGYETITQTITLNPDQNINLLVEMVKIPTDATLTGVVADAITGNPLAGATITIVDPDKTQSTATAVDGSYTIEDISMGNVEITASMAGYFTVTTHERFDQITTYFLDFDLYSETAQATVNGTVIKATTLLPEPGVEITVEGTEISVISDEDGLFALTDVPMGKQVLKVFKEDFADFSMEVNITEDPFQVDIVSPIVEGNPYPEKIDTNISGVIYDGLNGRPVGGAIVKLFGMDVQTTTDINGNYTFTDLPEGKITIIALALDHEAVSITLTVVPGTASQFDFTLPPTTRGVVSGTVTDLDTGEPIRFVNIGLENSLLEASTEADGTYELVGVPSGTYNFKAVHPEYLEQESSPVIVIHENTTTINFTLTHKPVTGSLEGIIKDINTDVPISGAVLSVQNTSITGSTDVNGYYKLNNLPAGLNTLNIEAAGYPSTTRTTSVVADTDYSTPTITTADFELDMADPDPPDSISELIYAVDGGVVEMPDKSFMLVIPPNGLSGDAIVTLMKPSTGPFINPGDELNLDPDLGMNGIKAVGKPVQLVIESAVEGDEIPTVENWMVVSGRYSQTVVDNYSIAESSIFPYYWDSTCWTVMNVKPYELAVDTINNLPLATLDFTNTGTGNPILARLGTRKPIMLASLDDYTPKLNYARIFLFLYAGILTPIELVPEPNIRIYDKDELKVATQNPNDLKKPNPNALPLLIIHGWDPKSIFTNSAYTNPNDGVVINTDIEFNEKDANRYSYILADLVNATNGVYRPIFVTFNPRAGMLSIGNALHKKYGSLEHITGLPGSTGQGSFPFIDTFGYSMGGLISRVYQAHSCNVHNMILAGTPNHGTFGFIDFLTNFGLNNLLDTFKVWSPGTTDLLAYDDDKMYRYVQNPMLALLNNNPSSTSNAEMTLIAGTDSALPFGWLLEGDNDGIVTKDSVFCRTSVPWDEPDKSLLKINSPAERYEFISPFNHYNFGDRTFRIKDNVDLLKPIVNGFSDWIVAKKRSSNVSIFNDDDAPDYIATAEIEVEIEYNIFTPWPLETRESRDITRVALVIYGKDENGQWHVGCAGIEPDGSISYSRPLKGNSIDNSEVMKLSTNIFYQKEDKITEVQFVVIPLGPKPVNPNEDKVPLIPESNFGIP